jgi:uroporphyrin-3 C-methyltransferase
MTQNETEQPPVTAETSSQAKSNDTNKPAKNEIHKVIVAVLLVLVFVFSGGFYLAKKIQGVEKASQSSVDTLTARNETFSATDNSLKNEIRQLRSQLDVIKDAINRLNQQQLASNEDWSLAEVEYLLIIASQRILLERDVDTAIVAMEAAELRIRDLGNPDLIPVREQLVADINKLKAVKYVDITGLSIYLADIIERASSLPLKNVILKNSGTQGDQGEINNQTQTGFVWSNFVSTVWRELKGLVVIKHSGETRQALLLPDQEYFLYQNLRLELENARLSVLHRDTDNLRTSVNLLVNWLTDHFNTEDAAVENVIETLGKMSDLNLRPDLPDINSSLETLRAYIKINSASDNGQSDNGELLP